MEDCQSASSFPMAYGGRRENASRSSYIQESGFSFLKLFKGSQIHEFGVLEFVKKIPSALGGKSWGGFGAHHFFTGIVNNSRRNTAWKTVTGVGQVVLSIEPYTTQIYGNLGYFPWKCTNLSGKIWVAADSQRRRNNALFPRSEAKGKLVLFRSQQRRLRLVLLQQRGNSSVICRALSQQLHIWIDQQRGNMLPTHIHPDSFLTAGYLFTRDSVSKHVLHTGL